MSNATDPLMSPLDLPMGWMNVRVADAGAVRLGRQRSPDQATGDYPTKYVRAANITVGGVDTGDLFEMNFTPGERRLFGLKAGDVLLTEASGSPSQVGRAAIWRGEVEPCCYQNTVIRFRPHLTTPEYALLVFRHMAAAGLFASAARGVGIQHLGASRFAELDFRLPPFTEQNRIVEVVNHRLDEIREADVRLRSALAYLDEQVKEILAAAVAGELVSQDEGDVAPSALSADPSHTQADLFGAASETPNLEGFYRILPVGWNWRRVDGAGDVALGRQRSPEHERGKYLRPYLRVANVLEDKIDFSDIKEMNFSPEEAARYRLQVHDVLLNEGQSPELLGRPAIYRGELEEVYFQNHLIRFRANPDVEPEYALLVFRNYMHTGVFRSIARWSTNIANMGLERFRALPFPIPPLAEQSRIVAAARARLDATRQQSEAVRASLGRLPELERELLAAAVAGELAPQDPQDEPAPALKARLGSPPPSSSLSSPDAAPPGVAMASRKPRPSQQAEPRPDLAATLHENGDRLPLPELFALAGYNRDQPEHVELFYLALRASLGTAMRIQDGGESENAVVEIVDAA